jgi:hypothetical protein
MNLGTRAAQRPSTALCVRDLRCDALYISPRGRLCKLMPVRTRGIGSGGDQFEFRYLERQAEGFWLRESNLRLMRLAPGPQR